MTQNSTAQYIAFFVLMASALLEIQALWGLLFLFWTIQSFNTGHAFLLGPVSRQAEPLLFWLVQVAWLVFGILMIVGDFAPEWR